MSLCMMIYSSPKQMVDSPPITHCLYSSNEYHRGQICLYDPEEDYVLMCGQTFIRQCATQVCLPSVRFCETTENSVDKLMLIIIMLGLLLACGLLITTFLQWSSDYYNFFVYSNYISGGHGIIHRSLVCSVVENGNIGMLRVILAKSQNEAKISLDISKADSYGDTPLHLACENGDARMVATLIEHNAMIDSLDKDGQSPLHIAAINGSHECVELMIKTGGSVDLQDDQGQTPLLLATQNGHDSIMDLLLKSGASPDLQDNFGRSPLHLSTQGGKIHCAERLIRFRAKLDIRDMYASSPLHWAVFWDKIDLVELLIGSGAAMDLLDDEGKSPLRLAIIGGKHDIAELLMSAGAGIDGLYRRSEVW